MKCTSTNDCCYGAAPSETDLSIAPAFQTQSNIDSLIQDDRCKKASVILRSSSIEGRCITLCHNKILTTTSTLRTN